MARKSVDVRVQEITQTRICLRSDLIFRPDSFSGRPCFIIEDPIRSAFFRIGSEERFLLSLLDGKATIGDVIARCAQHLGKDAFSEHDVTIICRWLLENELATTDASTRPGRLTEATSKAANQKWFMRLNPLFIQIPLFNPDQLLTRWSPYLGWVFGLPAFLIWIVTLLFAGSQVLARWSQLEAASVGILAPGNWLALGIFWCVLKMIHELSHGLACRRYGGNVPECGIVLILFAPMAYVDATSSWRFKNKWPRIITAAAGIYAEAFVASAAALIWSFAEAPLLNHYAFNVMILASVNTVVFNANPLMRFDGYYILADAVEIPNLVARGNEYLKYLGRRYALGLKVSIPEFPRRRALFIKAFGILAAIWRGLVVVSLLLAAHVLFSGFGLIFAFIAAVLWIGVPLLRFAKYLVVGNSVEKPNLFRFLLATGGGTCVAAMILGLVPWPGIASAPAIVRNAPRSTIRANVAGFVEEIRVADGQKVDAGQALFQLRNPALELALEDLKLEIESNRILRDSLLAVHKTAAAQAETLNLEGLRKKLIERRQQVEQLRITAPFSGCVVRHGIESLRGSYVRPGQELVELVGPGREVKVSIDQKDVHLFSGRIGKSVRLTVNSVDRLKSSGLLIHVEPRASRDVADLAITAIAGGPVPVKPIDTRTTGSASLDDKDVDGRYEFISPRFVGTGRISISDDTLRKSGHLATVWFRPYEDTIGRHLYRAGRDWLSERFQEVQDAANVPF